MEFTEIIVMGSLFVVGTVSTVAYYFARYFLFPENNELLEKPKEKQDQKEEEVKTQTSVPVKTLADALSNSKKGIWSHLLGSSSASETSTDMDSFEEALYMADLGPKTVSFFIEKASEKFKGQKSVGVTELQDLFKEEVTSIFKEGKQGSERLASVAKNSKPHVIMVVGVNGAGKTTTIGKLAHYFSEKGLKTLVAAGDTFRAAAESQLNVWAERSDTLIFKAPPNTTDPGAVAFQALEKAKKEDVDVVLIDTAGRLHTQSNLMAELEKVKRVMKKHGEDYPQDVWMILDANTGQNALFQAESFNKSLDLTGIVMTKVDGTAKAGMAVGVKHSLGTPILFLGLGEGMNDLREFETKAFVDSLV